MSKVAFSGCRDREITQGMFNLFIEEGDTVLVGDCPTGVDRCVRKWAKLRGFTPEIEYANWDAYNKAAGPIRNEAMVKKADRLIAFWDGKSKGTKSAILSAMKHHVDFQVIFL